MFASYAGKNWIVSILLAQGILVSTALNSLASDKVCDEILVTWKPISTDIGRPEATKAGEQISAAPITPALPPESGIQPKIDIAKYDPKLDDADYVIKAGLAELHRLRELPLLVREKTPISFFKEQIPRVLGILDLIPHSHYDRTYQFIDQNGDRIHERQVSNVGQAIRFLRAEGLKRRNENTATLEWFPEFVIDVLALRYAAFEALTPMSIKEQKKPVFLMI